MRRSIRIYDRAVGGERDLPSFGRSSGLVSANGCSSGAVVADRGRRRVRRVGRPCPSFAGFTLSNTPTECIFQQHWETTPAGTRYINVDRGTCWVDIAWSDTPDQCPRDPQGHDGRLGSNPQQKRYPKARTTIRSTLRPWSPAAPTRSARGRRASALHRPPRTCSRRSTARSWSAPTSGRSTSTASSMPTSSRVNRRSRSSCAAPTTCRLPVRRPAAARPRPHRAAAGRPTAPRHQARPVREHEAHLRRSHSGRARGVATAGPAVQRERMGRRAARRGRGPLRPAAQARAGRRERRRRSRHCHRRRQGGVRGRGDPGPAAVQARDGAQARHHGARRRAPARGRGQPQDREA